MGKNLQKMEVEISMRGLAASALNACDLLEKAGTP